jgi:hypothetical protein
MGNSKAIGRRGRVLRRANERAQRRFHDAIDAGVIFDETAVATIRYLEAERLVDAIMFPEEHSLPVVQLEDILRGLRYETLTPYASKIDEYQSRGA